METNKNLNHPNSEFHVIISEIREILVEYHEDKYNPTNAKIHIAELINEARIILRVSLKNKNKKVVREAKESLNLLDKIGKSTEKFVDNDD